MAITFPASPSNGDVFTNSTTGVKYIYNATDGVWKTHVWPTNTDYLQLSGGTLTGNLSLGSNDLTAQDINSTTLTTTGGVTVGNGLTVSDGNVVMAAGHGIDFSADSNASGMTNELLDDYEQGTWTPQLLGGTSNPSLTYSAQSGGYEKIGNLIHLGFFMNVSAVNSQGSGYLELHGLPYAPITSPLGASEIPGLVLQTSPFADGKAANRFAFVRTVGGSTRMFVGYRDLTTGNAIIPSNAAANIATGYFIGHITYRTD